MLILSWDSSVVGEWRPSPPPLFSICAHVSPPPPPRPPLPARENRENAVNQKHRRRNHLNQHQLVKGQIPRRVTAVGAVAFDPGTRAKLQFWHHATEKCHSDGWGAVKWTVLQACVRYRKGHHRHHVSLTTGVFAAHGADCFEGVNRLLPGRGDVCAGVWISGERLGWCVGTAGSWGWS